MKAMHARAILFFAGAAGVALLGTAWMTSRARHHLEEQLTAARERQATLRRELRQTQEKSTASTAAPGDPATAAKPASAAAPTQPAAFPPRSKPPGLLDFARENPQLLNEFIAFQKAQLAPRYGSLFQRLNLSPEQREKFKDIKVAAAARSSDIAAAADAQGLRRDDPAIATLRENSERRAEAELAALLGDAGMRELKEHERTANVRGFADGLAVQTAATEPLGAMQADELTRVLAAASASYRGGNHADSRDIDWAAVDAQARSFLTRAQFEVWRRGTAHNPLGGSRANLELQRVYAEAVKAAKRSGGGG